MVLFLCQFTPNVGELGLAKRHLQNGTGDLHGWTLLFQDRMATVAV